MEDSVRGARAGFTLIELLIVAGIICIICAIAIPKLMQLHHQPIDWFIAAQNREFQHDDSKRRFVPIVVEKITKDQDEWRIDARNGDVTEGQVYHVPLAIDLGWVEPGAWVMLNFAERTEVKPCSRKTENGWEGDRDLILAALDVK